MNDIADIRAFSRFYTRLVGALETGHLDTRFSLSEARVLYELASRGTASAAEIARAMDVNPAHLSRIVARLGEDGAIALTPNAADRRQTDLSLTESGKADFAMLDGATNTLWEKLVAPLSPVERATLVGAMHSIRTLLGDRPAAGPLVLRPPRIGDLGWLIHRQALVYHQQFGWNADYEGLIAGIYSRFQQAPESPPKALWVAERDGRIVGSAFVMPSEGIEGSAQLRMLYTEPEARGQGIGTALVRQCVAFARDNGYARMRLWTHTNQEAARRLYAAAGFAIVETMPEHNFGKDLTGEIWERAIRLDQPFEVAK